MRLLISGLLFGYILAADVWAAAYPFNEGFDADVSAWSLTGAWTTTASRAHSASRCLTDSPNTLFGNSSDSWAVLADGIDLTTATRPVLRFYHQYELENTFDIALVQASTNGGGAWISLAEYSACQPGWSREQLDLSPFSGAASLLLRFRLTTDSSVVMDGWYVDDVRIAEAPLAPVLNTVSAQGPNAIGLRWTASASPALAEYRILRSRSAGVTWSEAQCVGVVLPTATNYIDCAVVPKTTYYYRVLAVDSNEVHGASNEIGAATPAGMDFPFLDNGESGPAAWAAEGTWALSTESAWSPVMAWSDSPGGSYTNGLNSSLRLAAPVNLTASRAPVLCFNHFYSFQAGDLGSAEISTNGGQDWASLVQYTGTAMTNWMRQRCALSAYTNAGAALFRFRVTSDASGVSDGWHLDDISVSEAPDAIPAPVVAEVGAHSLRLTWIPCTNTQFAGYAVVRSETAGASLNSVLVTTLVDRATVTFVDSGLALDTAYYYRVYAVNPHGGYSADGTESATRTLNNGLPFNENFEGPLTGWKTTGFWGLASGAGIGGGTALSDSPSAFYSNNVQSTALTSVDLRGTVWPVLRFKDRYSFAWVGGDRGRVEVSLDGSAWTYVYGVIQARTNWQEQVIDLSPWKGYPNVRIRFWFESDGSSQEDGWTIDEVSVAENTWGALAYPFHDNFESGLSNWFCAAWIADTNSAFAGTMMAHDHFTPYTPNSVQHRLVLGGALALTSAVNPQVTFWAKGQNDSAGFYVHISKDGGVNWLDLSGNFVLSATWKRFQFSIPDDHKVADFRMRFMTGQPPWDTQEQFYLDNVVVEDLPVAVTLLPLVPHLKSVDLNWTGSGLGGALRRYEVYRATHPTVTVADTLVGSFTSASSTNLTDSGLAIGQTYYYKVFVVNTNDVYAGSNEGVITTVPITLPLTDNLETLANWDVTGSWAITTASSHGGAGCLTDSPGGNYANNQSSYAITAVNLSGKQWPVLRFWDRYDLPWIGGDRGRVEISINGSSWACVYGVMQSRTNWQEQVVDLSPWKGYSNVRIRFWLESDGSTVGDGWYIDDVSVAEHTPLVLGYPFQDGFENGMSNWLCSAWVQDTNGVYAGQGMAHDKIAQYTPNSVQHNLLLGGVLGLTSAVSPQVTFWAKGQNDSAGFYVYLSKDDGVSWLDLSGNMILSATWKRFQFAIPADYKVANLRMRFMTGQPPWDTQEQFYLDNVVVEDLPAAVTFSPLVPDMKSIQCNWSVATLGAGFRRYEVYRATHPTVTFADTLIGSYTNVSDTHMTDTGLLMGQLYYYKVYVVDTNETYSGSIERQATTVPLVLPLTDDFSTVTNWVLTGGWGLASGTVHSGTTCLSDSPVGSYNNSESTYAMTTVNLAGRQWPVLRFWDRYNLAWIGGDRGRVEISINGSSWAYVYGVMQARTNWQEQVIDLSPWKGYSNVRIRFVLESDGSTVEDGWYIDDVTVDENSGASMYPFYDGFEAPMSNQWLHSAWSIDTNGAYAGQGMAHDKCTTLTSASIQHWLIPCGQLNLTSAVMPKLTFWAKGLNDSAGFYVYMSRDGGISWADLTGNLVLSGTWQKYQYTIPADYRVQDLRLRFMTGQPPWDTQEHFYLDNVGLGEPAPSVPSLNYPAPGSTLRVQRPTLIINNAIDYQSDLMTYRFEVAADSQFSNIVAQVPSLSAGAVTTAWTLDSDLADGTQYWWRCRASDGVNTGAWMAAESFLVSLVNTPPSPVRLASPPPGSILSDLTATLGWFPAVETNIGDSVAAYQLQIASEPLFTNLVVNDSQVPSSSTPDGSNWVMVLPLSSFAGASGLVTNKTYFWRVRAEDTWNEYSSWSTGLYWFVYGNPPPNISGFSKTTSGIGFSWQPTGKAVYIDYTPKLVSPSWSEVAGPIYGTNWSLEASGTTSQGFYRARSE